jgi:hypothetical protein
MKPPRPRPDGSTPPDGSGHVDVPIPLALYEAVVRKALRNGKPPTEWVQEALEEMVKALKAPPKDGD